METSRRLLSDLSSQFHSSLTPAAEMEATLELTLVLSEAGSCELTVEYTVPNSCWRPYHVVEWLDEGLRFACQGCVWQNTGEDWGDVSVLFSTERSAMGTEPPSLQAEVLHPLPKAKKTLVTTREETIHQVEERRSAVPGIDAGGETLKFASTQPVTVPSDGRPHRVPLFEFEAPLREERVLMGELATEVFVKTSTENHSTGPILAGPVDLIKSCGLVGRGVLEYAAPGQTFTVNWGPHPELRGHREDQISAQEKSLVSGWISKEHQVEVHISNLGPHPQRLEVLERVPVSELKNVKIEQNVAKTTGRLAHDGHGFLRFPVELEPFGRRTISLTYTVSRKKDVEGL